MLSIKSECLDRIVLLSEAHLRTAVSEYVNHYHLERHHQGLDGQLVDASDPAEHHDGSVVCRGRLGGMLNHYYREAA